MERVGFNFIQPIELQTVVRGEEITFSPLTVAELPGFARAVREIPRVFNETVATILTGEADTGALVALVAMDSVIDHGPSLIEAVAVAARRRVDWVSTLRADELLALASLAVRVNADFFFRALPEMSAVVSATATALASVTPPALSTGPTPSSN